jgi:hypothetical protein
MAIVSHHFDSKKRPILHRERIFRDTDNLLDYLNLYKYRLPRPTMIDLCRRFEQSLPNTTEGHVHYPCRSFEILRDQQSTVRAVADLAS